MSSRVAAVLLILSGLLLWSGGTLSRRLLSDLEREQADIEAIA